MWPPRRSADEISREQLEYRAARVSHGVERYRHQRRGDAGLGSDGGPAMATLRRLYETSLGAVTTVVAGRTTDDTVGRHVDLVLHSAIGAAVAETLCWIEDIVDRVRAMRQRMPAAAERSRRVPRVPMKRAPRPTFFPA